MYMFYFISGLKDLTCSALIELLEELEVTIKDYSETLIHQLALRDELEYEKEIKNHFISLLLSIQRKRRETQVDKKRNPNILKRQRGTTHTEPGTVSNVLCYLKPFSVMVNFPMEIYQSCHRHS